MGLPDLEVTGICYRGRTVCVSVRYIGIRRCPFCDGQNLRDRGRRVRRVRHESIGERHCELEIESRKWLCRVCGKSFWQRFPGILPGKRSSEPFRRSVANQHRDGINRSCLSKREKIGSATVGRWFHDCLGRLLCEVKNAPCPRVLGIDEHFFSRKDGYATTLCDLGKNKVYDVVLGRSEASLEGYLTRLKGKDLVEVVCMDLSSTYRAIVKKHFPKAKIVADRFHVIRLVNHHFLATWKMLDPVGGKSRGLLSLMRRHRANLKSPEQADRLEAYLSEMPVLKLHLRLQARSVSHPTAQALQGIQVPGTRKAVPKGRGRTRRFETRTTRHSGRNASLMARGDRQDVEVHQKQRNQNHRRVPQQDGVTLATSIRV